jgi:hypothetical protein
MSTKVYAVDWGSGSQVQKDATGLRGEKPTRKELEDLIEKIR